MENSPDFSCGYASLEFADAYCGPRGLWPLSAAAPEDADGELVEGEDGEDAEENAEEAAMPDEAESGAAEAAALVAKKRAALIRAFDWLNTLSWKGEKLDWLQLAAWPRKNVPMPGNEKACVPQDMVPMPVLQAQCELAALIYNGLDPFQPRERGGLLLAESHSSKEGDLDVIGGDSKSDSYTWAETAPVETLFPGVIGYLRPFLLEVPGEAKTCVMVEAGRG